MTQIRLENISKTFLSASSPSSSSAGAAGQGVRAVDGVSLSVESGELFFLLGPSGCGKTTLLRIIAALTAADSGRIFFDDRDVTNLPVEKRDTAMVFQSYALWPHMTVGKNVQFGPRMRGVGRDQRRQTAAECLKLVQMEGYEQRKVNQLSGGQQQRVAVARALAAGGKCLLLDEPLSNLDARLRMHMRTELRELVKSTGITAVYVTHDQKEALSMADRIAVMDAGKIVQIAAPEELYNRPATRFVADFLGEANFLDGKVLSAGEVTEVQTAAGALQVAGCPDVEADQEVTCCIRPERTTVSASSDASLGAHLPAKVESCMYLGETRQYTCRLPGGTKWKALTLSTSAPHASGDEVHLILLPEDIVLLKR